MVILKSRGLIHLYKPAHRAFMITPNSSATSPLCPRMFDLSEEDNRKRDVQVFLQTSFMVRNFTYLEPVDVLQVAIVVEVISHCRSVTQTLQDGVHIACVSQVTKASQWCTQTSKCRIQVANFGSWGPCNFHFRIYFSTSGSGKQIRTMRR